MSRAGNAHATGIKENVSADVEGCDFRPAAG
jgi:hypothetical protein